MYRSAESLILVSGVAVLQVRGREDWTGLAVLGLIVGHPTILAEGLLHR